MFTEYAPSWLNLCAHVSSGLQSSDAQWQCKIAPIKGKAIVWSAGWGEEQGQLICSENDLLTHLSQRMPVMPKLELMPSELWGVINRWLLTPLKELADLTLDFDQAPQYITMQPIWALAFSFAAEQKPVIAYWSETYENPIHFVEGWEAAASAPQAMRFLLSLSVGWIELDPIKLKEVAAGDWLGFSASVLEEGQFAWLLLGAPVAKVQALPDGVLQVSETITPQQRILPPQSTENSVKIFAEVGQVTLSLEALNDLKPGQSLPVKAGLHETIRLRLDDHYVGTGRLVQVQDRWFVEVTNWQTLHPDLAFPLSKTQIEVKNPSPKAKKSGRVLEASTKGDWLDPKAAENALSTAPLIKPDLLQPKSPPPLPEKAVIAEVSNASSAQEATVDQTESVEESLQEGSSTDPSEASPEVDAGVTT